MYEYDGKRRTSMMWPSIDGINTTSESLARQWETQPRPHEMPGRTALRQLQEQLELSGTVEDYVSCIQRAITSLWDRHHDEPWVFVDVERLCLLVIRMVEMYPEAVVHQLQDGRSFYYGSWAYTQLITRYRRAWAEQYLSTYLRTRWETELREASRAYHQLMSNRGAPPALKQFARAAERATNHWFGGHVGELYSALMVSRHRSATQPAEKAAARQGVLYRAGSPRSSVVQFA